MIGHEITIKIIWTIFRSIILIFIVMSSFALLYSMDEIINSTITIKAIGHQLYCNAPFDENDRSATKCIRLSLTISKAFGLLKEKTKVFSFAVERVKKLNHARNGELRLNYLLE
jgi:heme/copper-type cytochrome/quinol oxidase subunit 2